MAESQVERKEVLSKDGLLHCSVCGDAVEKELDMPNFDGAGSFRRTKVHILCRCRKKELEEKKQKSELNDQKIRVDELRRLSLIDARSRNIRLSTFQKTENNRRALSIAMNYIRNFETMLERGQGLLFLGDVGTGKSYTAALIANELIDRLQPVIMTSFVKLIEDMRGTETDISGYLRRLNLARLLIIDDLGAERGTDYALEKVYDVVDSRYRTGKPVIFTTNLTITEMKECNDIRYNRIYDRIFEMCYPVKFEGLSWRKISATERFKEMKELLEG